MEVKLILLKFSVTLENFPCDGSHRRKERWGFCDEVCAGPKCSQRRWLRGTRGGYVAPDSLQQRVSFCCSGFLTSGGAPSWEDLLRFLAPVSRWICGEALTTLGLLAH
ncbi:hypothetical protein V8G54_000591 [Vigna mungo]|uniref:Uncharacterized protein n=1 Tax=Vigna mungo TaxID=3915 RepID=A0AAQ3P760_VIGMU